MAQFRKKPVVINAVQWNGNTPEIEHFMGDSITTLQRETDGNANVVALKIHTKEGIMRADMNDWIIKGVVGEFYPCKPDIFLKTYEPATPEEYNQFTAPKK